MVVTYVEDPHLLQLMRFYQFLVSPGTYHIQYH